MNAEEMEEKNRLIDVLFDQICALPDDAQRLRAAGAVIDWRSAKTCEFLGLGPMTARTSYRRAYEELSAMGLEVGGMLPPCECV